MDIDEILSKVQKGQLDLESAKQELKSTSFLNLGFARLDTSRKIRQGCAEVVFCQNKSDDHLLEIYKQIYQSEGEVLGTRANLHQASLIQEHIPQAIFDGHSGILKIEKENKAHKGLIAVCSAGTADIKVAEECAQTAEFFGSCVKRFYDIGVSGLHRLLSALPEIEKANCVVAIAGMEGALGTVIGGLVSSPVICVPTSVGYGANFKGLSALLTMLNSCANGVCTVNIDNGYGAGYLAHQINRQSKNF